MSVARRPPEPAPSDLAALVAFIVTLVFALAMGAQR